VTVMSQRPGNISTWHPIVAIGVVVLPALSGIAIGTDHGIDVIAIVGISLFVALGLFDWRRSIYGLLVYLPFSGIPIIAAYPRTALATLAKDVLFVIPAYLGFFTSRVTSHDRTTLKRGLTVPLALLSVLVVAQALNPLLPNRLVGVIGVKVWLFYIPLWILGYNLVRNRADLNRILAVMSIAAVIPALVGIAEAAIIYSGRAELVYRWYGEAASSATQDFAELSFEGGALRRIPSTFSFVAQYFAFTVSMVAITYAWWRGVLRHTRWSFAGIALWALTLVAGFLSGSRAAFLFIPLLMALLFLIERPAIRLPPLVRLLAISSVISLLVAFLGGTLRGLLAHVMQLAGEHFDRIFLEGLRQGLGITVFGLGTGIDTNASRYAFSAPTEFTGVGGVWYESWFVKVLLELGIAGLFLVILIFSILIVGGLRSNRRLHDPDLRVISAALLALLVWHVIYCMKGQYLDIDPTNVYFWLFAGMLAAIPRLDGTPDSTQERT
jgi:hypothetical protein